MLGHAVPLHEFDIDQLLDPLRCQHHSVKPKLPVPDGRPSQQIMRRGHRIFSGSLREFDRSNLLRGLHDTLFVERIAFRFETVSQLL
jgi:hypothetical protein